MFYKKEIKIFNKKTTNTVIKRSILVFTLMMCIIVPNQLVLSKNMTDAEKEKISKEVMSKIEIKNDNQYEVIKNSDGTNIYVIYNILGKTNNSNTPDNMIAQVDKDVNFYYSETGGNHYDNGVYNHKIEILQLAKKLNLNNLLTKMKDFCYHPYAVCEYDKFSKEELQELKKELEKVFDEYKEVDHGGPTGFASNSVIANIKSIDIAIKNYNEEKHKKYKNLSTYMFKDGVYDKYFTLAKNLVNVYESPYERSYKRTPVNRTEIRNIKDVGDYYEADLIIREDVPIDNVIGDKIKKDDILVVWTCEKDEIKKDNALILKCIGQSAFEKAEYDENYNKIHLGHQQSYFILLKGSEEYKYTDYKVDDNEELAGYKIGHSEEAKYYLEELEDEAIENVTQSVKTKARILKNARVLGSYFLDSIDKPLSNIHDYEFKEKFKDVVLSDIYNKNIYFRYPYGKEFYYPIIAKNKDDEEGEYGKSYLCDNFQNITMLTFDEKGYVTGIYKGEN